MGKRRIRLLKEISNISIYGIDSNQDRVRQVEKLFGIHCFNSLSEAINTVCLDCAFVCTSPLSHADIINECLENKLNVFTEINLVNDRYEENIRLAEKNGCVLFLSSTLLYGEETQTIINKVKDKATKLNYIYHVGQYLSDWHPWESYNNYFIGDKRTNGCREIMAIDMPWLITAFGNIKKVQRLKSKNTNLNVDYDDNYLMMIEHETGAKGVFAVDVISRKATRYFEVYGENLHLRWNGTLDSLYEYDIINKKEILLPSSETAEHIEGYADFVLENPYRKEIKAFLSQVEDRTVRPDWNFEKDGKLLEIIDVIES